MIRNAKPKLRLRETKHPILYEVNVRVLLNEVSAREGKRVTLGTLPDRILDEWAGLGFDAVWLMGVWTIGEISRSISRTHEGLLAEYRKVLSDFTEEDVAGSPYSVLEYVVPRALGGNAGLKKLRGRLADRGMALVLDFVGNHTARDHGWVYTHPEYFISGEPGDDERRPEIYFKATTVRGDQVLAYGRDPTFPGWTDTAQLNPISIPARTAIIAELRRVAELCDGVRCDMAMLLLRGVFLLTWGDRVMAPASERATREFWDEAIESVRKEFPSFMFIAEAYWNLEWQLQQLGFSCTYDKVLYDRLLREGAGSVRDHLRAEPDYQNRSLRFIENHDEPRASRAFGSEAWLYAAAVVMSTVPGFAMYHEGQLQGRAQRTPIQLGRRPQEAPAENTQRFYRQLLKVVQHDLFRSGEWSLLPPRAAWHDNYTWQNYLIFWWQGKAGGARLVVVNYAPHTGQCYVELPAQHLPGVSVEFRDRMSDATYVRDRASLTTRGMYFDLPPYGFHVFEVLKAK
jgi:glycosidase